MRIRYTTDQIQQRIEEISLYCQTDYMVDNIDILLRRSKRVAGFQSEIPLLISEAERIKNNAVNLHIDQKITKIRMLVAEETRLVNICTKMGEVLSDIKSTLQTQIKTYNDERPPQLRFDVQQSEEIQLLQKLQSKYPDVK